MKATKLENEYLSIEVLDYGARLVQLGVKPQAGQAPLTQVVAGYSALSDYLSDPHYMGAIVGPIANRIHKGLVYLEGNTYQLPINDGANSLHSGGIGFDKETWSIKKVDQYSINLELHFEMSKIGLPGTVVASAKYTLKRQALILELSLTPSVQMYLNPTHHAYFNLSGHMRRIDDHFFELFGDGLCAVDDEMLPSGEHIKLAQPTPYRLSQDSHLDRSGFNKNQATDNGVDNHFYFEGISTETEHLREMCDITSQHSGIKMQVRSSAPGFQLYTGNALTKPFDPQSSFCIEPQYVPNAVSSPLFSRMLTGANECMSRVIEWRFS